MNSNIWATQSPVIVREHPIFPGTAKEPRNGLASLIAYPEADVLGYCGLPGSTYARNWDEREYSRRHEWGKTYPDFFFLEGCISTASGSKDKK